MPTHIREKFLFLYKFIRSPKQVGSITPSSPFLAKTMVGQVPWHRVNAVAELGAGTGAITKFIAAARQKPTKVLLFEKDASLREALSAAYPEFGCYADASSIDMALKKEGLGEGQLDCILSGLPFFNFPQQLRDKLMEQIARSLKPGGLFIAFQYSQQMKKQLDRQFELEHVRFVPLNMPPAFVYVCRKREETVPVTETEPYSLHPTGKERPAYEL
ncbi:class I SAM-dependent methyltransferase [Paenibacillus ginsengarvi]|uniref:Methyltransferase domain-containing protein n=1 Tax=Paenibacillus ginsengarvi TaxID=400777 RepID=A0A3B0BKA7_9BACL|nr:methyltransferase domain-containing protein [Paenibacillus ginsengarvi]RKN71896.1 methyltransferase domain-containing protein [Paenibacillus ginsengarvi]